MNCNSRLMLLLNDFNNCNLAFQIEKYASF